MNVTLSNDAKDYIVKKSPNDPSLSIAVVQVKSGWCSTNQLSVRIGNPGNTSRFDEFSIEGVSIYIQKGLSVPSEEVTITLNNYLITKSISVKGVRY